MAIPVMLLTEYSERDVPYPVRQAVICDSEGNVRTIPSSALTAAMEEGKLRLVTNFFAPADPDKAFKQFEVYRARQKLAGMIIDDFEIVDKSILLKKVYVRKGTYTIPEFVSGIYTDGPTDSPFSECEELKLYNASSIMNFSLLFSMCNKLIRLDLSEFNTSKAVAMRKMFYGCGNLRYLDVSGFDTSNVIDMHRMFCHCDKLGRLDLSNFNTSKVVRTGSMFQCCFSLYDLNMSNFSIQSVFSMADMFCNLLSLETLDLSSFGKNKCYEFNGMFNACPNLNALDIHNMPVRKKACITNIFKGCSHQYNFTLHPSLRLRLLPK